MRPKLRAIDSQMGPRTAGLCAVVKALCTAGDFDYEDQAGSYAACLCIPHLARKPASAALGLMMDAHRFKISPYGGRRKLTHMSWSRQLRGLVPLDAITDGERQGKVRGGVRRDRLHIARELGLPNRQAKR
jgi:hypothetical protein